MEKSRCMRIVLICLVKLENMHVLVENMDTC